MNNYHLYEEIGHGKHSTVYKGRRRGTIQYVAIKSIDKAKRSRVLNEVSIAESLTVSETTNVCQVASWYETRNHLWTVAEYCAGGDLACILKQDQKILPEAQVRALAAEIVCGLIGMHSCGIILADLKPGNVLFTESGQVRLAGFSVSQRVSELETALKEGKQVPRRGSPFYMAPELFFESGCHTFGSDIWALGVLIFEIVTGATPYSACKSFQELQRSVMASSQLAPDLREGSEELRHLVARMLAKDPFERIRWRELVSHPWWNGCLQQREWEQHAAKIALVEDRIYSLLKRRSSRSSTRE
jgi:serine/threonine-protein kinase ULK4